MSRLSQLVLDGLGWWDQVAWLPHYSSTSQDVGHNLAFEAFHVSIEHQDGKLLDWNTHISQDPDVVDMGLSPREMTRFIHLNAYTTSIVYDHASVPSVLEHLISFGKAKQWAYLQMSPTSAFIVWLNLDHDLDVKDELFGLQALHFPCHDGSSIFLIIKDPNGYWERVGLAEACITKGDELLSDTAENRVAASTSLSKE